MISKLPTGPITNNAPAQAQAANESTGMQQGGHLMEWAVFFYAAGEVAASIAFGISHARKEKRREVKARENKEVPLLFYAEHKAPQKEAA